MTRLPINLLLLALATLSLVSLGAGRADETAASRTPTAPEPTPAPAPQRPVELMRDAGSDSPASQRVAVATTVTAQPTHLWMEVTAYCPCEQCCGPEAAGITASGLPVTHNGGRFVAADTSMLPFGSRVVVPGYAQAPVPVIDRGGAIRGQRLDVFFPAHDAALEWGRRWVLVSVLPE